MQLGRRTEIIQACEKKADKLEAERNKLEAYAGNELTEEIKNRTRTSTKRRNE